MKTKLTKTLAAVGFCCLSSMAFAGGPDMPHHDLYSGGLGLGIDWSEHLGFGALLSYTTDELTASLATNLVHSDQTFGNNQWQWGLNGELGLRDRLGMTNLFLKYGAGFGVVIITKKDSGEGTPWYVGPFVGLDYQPLRHFMISGSIFPVAYERDLIKDKKWEFFEEGNLSLSYIF